MITRQIVMRFCPECGLELVKNGYKERYNTAQRTRIDKMICKCGAHYQRTYNYGEPIGKSERTFQENDLHKDLMIQFLYLCGLGEHTIKYVLHTGLIKITQTLMGIKNRKEIYFKNKLTNKEQPLERFKAQATEIKSEKQLFDMINYFMNPHTDGFFIMRDTDKFRIFYRTRYSKIEKYVEDEEKQ